MNVQLLFSTIGDYMPKIQQPGVKPHQKLLEEITKNAIKAWKEREPNADYARFLQKMPAKHGSHFRFLTVTQKDEDTLLVSGGRTQ